MARPSLRLFAAFMVPTLGGFAAGVAPQTHWFFVVGLVSGLLFLWLVNPAGEGRETSR